jgi:hypothetical protein
MTTLLEVRTLFRQIVLQTADQEPRSLDLEGMASHGVRETVEIVTPSNEIRSLTRSFMKQDVCP